MTTSAGEPADSAEAPDRSTAPDRPEGTAAGGQIDDNSMPFDMRDKYDDSPSSSDRVDSTADSAEGARADIDSAAHGDDPDSADDTPS